MFRSLPTDFSTYRLTNAFDEDSLKELPRIEGPASYLLGRKRLRVVCFGQIFLLESPNFDIVCCDIVVRHVSLQQVVEDRGIRH